MKTFEEVIKTALQQSQKRVIAVAAAADEDVLAAIKAARELELAEPVLIGDKAGIAAAAQKAGLNLAGIKICHEPDHASAARKAVALIRDAEADILMKGILSSAHFLKAVLDKDKGIRKSALLSHVAVFELPALSRFLLMTDGGMNISPGLQDKVEIINNACRVAQALRIEQPKTAAACAIETVNPEMQATVDAALLAKMSERGQIKGTIVDGPLALDNAVSPESAAHKGIKSPVAGSADIILAPDIEAGNIMYKTLVYLAGTLCAGIVMGAAAPIVLTSRSDSPQVKLNSIALSILAAG